MLFPATKSELVKRNLDNIFRKHLYPNIVSLLNLEIFVQVRKSVNATGLAFVHIEVMFSVIQIVDNNRHFDFGCAHIGLTAPIPHHSEHATQKDKHPDCLH